MPSANPSTQRLVLHRLRAHVGGSGRELALLRRQAGPDGALRITHPRIVGANSNAGSCIRKNEAKVLQIDGSYGEAGEMAEKLRSQAIRARLKVDAYGHKFGSYK